MGLIYWCLDVDGSYTTIKQKLIPYILILIDIYFIRLKLQQDKYYQTLIPQNQKLNKKMQWIIILSVIYNINIIISKMSHVIIKRRRTQSLRSKMHSEQSHIIAPRHSIGRILNDNISKRRFTTSHNSPDQFQDLHIMSNQIQQAKTVYKDKNTKSALVMFKKLQKKYPQNKQIAYFIGSCCLNQGNYDSALINFKNCLNSDGLYNKNIYICMAICYKSQGKFKQCMQILDAGCQKYPRFKDAHFYKGKIYLKLGQFNEAAHSFRKCIRIQPNDENSTYFLAQCLKNLGLIQQSLQKYQSLIKANSKHMQKAIVKRISILIDLKKFNQANLQINKATSKNISLAELSLLKGVCQYELANYNQAATCFQLSLTSNISEANITKAFRYLIQISIKQKDFFQAEHLISRSKFANVDQKILEIYYKLVEGINDLIKRRLPQCEQKLSFLYSITLKQVTDSQKFIHQNCLPYYAYCMFSQQKYQKSLDIYKQCVSNKPSQKKVQLYNCCICEGLVLHKRKQFGEAQQKFKQAQKLLQDKVEPFFLICVNLVQQKKQCLQQQKTNKKLFLKLQKQFQAAANSNCQSPLFLFYQSLVLLFQGRNASEIIRRAISNSQQQVSQYYFIQALAYSLNGETLKGLHSITKAIELDQNIPQFFKERSKYYYVLQRFHQAVSDIANIIELNQDQQAKLLLTFYYYMTDQYSLSLQILKQISSQCAEDRFKQFQTALNFRLHQYDKCGIAGTLISKIIKKQPISEHLLFSIKQDRIGKRQVYSQFTVCYFHLLLSAYYFYTNNYDQCLQHLFGCLQQIQGQAQADQAYASTSQILLNQIKFNIAISSLMRQLNSKQQASYNFQQTTKYVEMFIAETQDANFIKTMGVFLQLLKMKKQRPDNNKQIVRTLELYPDIAKLSDDLPEMNIRIGSSITINTKFLILFPQKLKFNICPQFDQSFLFNFDIDKIQSKLCPPWFKLHQGHIYFTDKIRNQSILISQTDKAPTPSLILAPSPLPQDLRQKLKLDDAVEKKLQKMLRLIQNKNNKSDL